MKAKYWLWVAALAGVTACPLTAAENAPAVVPPAPAAPAAPATDAPAKPAAEGAPAVDKEAKQAFMDQARELLEKAKADGPATAEAKPGDAPAAPAASAAPAAEKKKPLDKNILKLAETFAQLQKDIYNNRDRNHINTYFKAQYDLVKLLPEFVYIGKENRDRLAEDNKDLAAYFKTNAKSIAQLEDLAAMFQQRLGLEGVKINVPRKMTQASAPPSKVTADIGLSADGDAEGPKDVSREMTQNDRYMVAACEDHLKRLATYQARQSFVECERDWQGLDDMLAGAYFFQLIVQNDPRYGLTYPYTLKFLQSMPAGKVKIPGSAAAADKPAHPAKADRKPH